MQTRNLNTARVASQEPLVMSQKLMALKDIPNQKLQKDQGWILQIISCKEFELKEEDQSKKLKIKAKYTLSDGVSFVTAMVSDIVYAKLDKAPKNFDVIKVDSFQKVFVQEKILLMLKDPVSIVHDKLDAKLGAPEDFKKVMENPENFEMENKIDITVKESVKAVVAETPKPVVEAGAPKQFYKKEPEMKVQPKIEDLASNNYMPVKVLNTFTRDWIIKARVSKRGDVKTTRNGGQLLKIELVDQFGTSIEGTFFNDAAKMFGEILEENKVYLFSNGSVKMANKKFTSVKNDFCIIFDKNSQIHEAKDDGSIAAQSFDFVKIGDIQEIVQARTIDVCGIVSQIGDRATINLKSGESKVKMQIQLMDDTNNSISLTMWGDEICDKNEHLCVGDVIAIKSARLSDFSGKSLNASNDHAAIFTGLENADCQRIKKWYDSQMNNGVDLNEQVTSLTRQLQRRNDDGDAQAEKKASNLNLITEINDSLQEENDTDKLHFFFLNGYVSSIKNNERIYYPACKGEGCKKKVTEENGGYHCEGCGKTFADFQPTYMITAKISDFTESVFVTFAREHGATLMGMTADKFKEFKENNSEEDVQNYFDSLLFKRFNIMVKGKFEYFNGENRMRYFAIKVFPHNVQAENNALLKRLEMYSQME